MHPILMLILFAAAGIGYLVNLSVGAAWGVVIVAVTCLVVVIVGSVLDKHEEYKNPELARVRQIKRRLGMLP